MCKRTTYFLCESFEEAAIQNQIMKSLGFYTEYMTQGFWHVIMACRIVDEV